MGASKSDAAGESTKQGKRSTVLIDRDFQLRFIGRLGIVLFFYLLVFLVISVVAPVAFTFLGDAPDWAMTETAFRVEVLLRLILAPLVCTFLCLFAHGVLETFRVAGPNYRYKAVLRDLANLRIPRGVRTRKGDYLHDTTAAFDQALTSMHDYVRDLKSASVDAATQVKIALVEAPSDEASLRAMNAVNRIEQLIERFELLTCAPECKPIPMSEERGEEPVEPMVERGVEPGVSNVDAVAAPNDDDRS